MARADESEFGAPVWLVAASGEEVGTRYRLPPGRVRIGRDPSNDIVPEGESSGVVSKRHAEILPTKDGLKLVDLESRNGTYLDGERIPVNDPTPLLQGCQIQLGAGGPEYELQTSRSRRIEETIVASSPLAARDPDQGEGAESEPEADSELVAAVQKARRARAGKGTGQTLMIMRDVMRSRTLQNRQLRLLIGVLTLALVLVSIYAVTTHLRLRQEKVAIDEEINQIEAALSTARDPDRIEALIDELDQYQVEAREIQRNLLYSLGLRDQEVDFVGSEIGKLMADLGAPQYSIPTLFQERVRHYIARYQDSNRSHLIRALGAERETLQKMRAIFREQNLPADLAFITIVESAFRWGSRSSHGAAGPWQFVPATARAFGLKVDSGTDERFDIEKSSVAAARYLRRLISEFGAGNSAMLALAAYNLGPTRVRRVVRSIEDPIEQRDFWHLYRSRTLPPETREYVPKIVAVIVMLRNPDSFGLEGPAFQPVS